MHIASRFNDKKNIFQNINALKDIHHGKISIAHFYNSKYNLTTFQIELKSIINCNLIR